MNDKYRFFYMRYNKQTTDSNKSQNLYNFSCSNEVFQIMDLYTNSWRKTFFSMLTFFHRTFIDILDFSYGKMAEQSKKIARTG